MLHVVKQLKVQEEKVYAANDITILKLPTSSLSQVRSQAYHAMVVGKRNYIFKTSGEIIIKRYNLKLAISRIAAFLMSLMRF